MTVFVILLSACISFSGFSIFNNGSKFFVVNIRFTSPAITSASFTGTAFPICLYLLSKSPQNSISGGNV